VKAASISVIPLRHPPTTVTNYGLWAVNSGAVAQPFDVDQP
jgi:hypothetical protein